MRTTLLIISIFFLLLTACSQNKNASHFDPVKHGTPLEEILSAEPNFGQNDFSTALAQKGFNTRECDVMASLAEIDVFELSHTGRNCKVAISDDFYLKKSSFYSISGVMPYVEIGRKSAFSKPQENDAPAAIFLVGGPGDNIWGDTDSSFGLFIRELLNQYSAVYLPAYYGTSGRSKASGTIINTAAIEIEYFLEFLSAENTKKIEILSASAGGPLSTLIKSPHVQRNILINPPLESLRKVYRLRKAPIFHGSKSERAAYVGFRVGLGDVVTLVPENSKFYVENNAEYILRYYGEYFDISVLDYIKTDESSYQGCTHVLVGQKDKIIGRSLIDFDAIETPFLLLPGVNHNFHDTISKREVTLNAIFEARRAIGVCGD